MSVIKSVVNNIEGMINEFKDKINELERQLRFIGHPLVGFNGNGRVGP